MIRYRSGSWLAVACLLIAGCHKAVRVVAAPPPPHPEMVSVPPVTHPSEPLAHMTLEDSPSLALLLPRRSIPRFQPLRATRAQLAGLTPPAPPPITLGQLTAGGEASSGNLRQLAEDLLHSQQRRLIGLPSAFAVSHSQQFQQARLFLQQASEALEKLDFEGTRTLATKAKVLLDELQA